MLVQTARATQHGRAEQGAGSSGGRQGAVGSAPSRGDVRAKRVCPRPVRSGVEIFELSVVGHCDWGGRVSRGVSSMMSARTLSASVEGSGEEQARAGVERKFVPAMCTNAPPEDRPRFGSTLSIVIVGVNVKGSTAAV